MCACESPSGAARRRSRRTGVEAAGEEAVAATRWSSLSPGGRRVPDERARPRGRGRLPGRPPPPRQPRRVDASCPPRAAPSRVPHRGGGPAASPRARRRSGPPGGGVLPARRTGRGRSWKPRRPGTTIGRPQRRARPRARGGVGVGSSSGIPAASAAYAARAGRAKSGSHARAQRLCDARASHLPGRAAPQEALQETVRRAVREATSLSPPASRGRERSIIGPAASTGAGSRTRSPPLAVRGAPPRRAAWEPRREATARSRLRERKVGDERRAPYGRGDGRGPPPRRAGPLPAGAVERPQSRRSRRRTRRAARRRAPRRRRGRGSEYATVSSVGGGVFCEAVTSSRGCASRIAPPSRAMTSVAVLRPGVADREPRPRRPPAPRAHVRGTPPRGT